jgi:hypothetical protein
MLRSFWGGAPLFLMQISLVDAVAYVRAECAIDALPAVEESHVETLLARCRMPDDEGRLVDDAAWEESYDLDQACALVWEHRAGLAFNQFDVGAGPNRQTRSQIAEHCRAQAQRYRARRAASFPPGMIEA